MARRRAAPPAGEERDGVCENGIPRPETGIEKEPCLCYHIPQGGICMQGEDHAPHRHQSTKAVVNRMSRAIGHLEAVKQMVEEDRDCSEVLIQLAAVQSALRKAGKMILTDHIEHCVLHAEPGGKDQAMSDLSRALDQFLK